MGERGSSRRWTLVFLAAAAGHLGFVILGASHTHLPGGGWTGEALAYYATLSGAGSAYDFFAPPVAAFPWARFQVTDAAGTVSGDVLESGVNREADLRVRNMIGFFALQQDEAMRRALAASFAGKVLARHPGAESVVFRLETCELPSMLETRAGKPPTWALRYEAKFVPRKRIETARETREDVP